MNYKWILLTVIWHEMATSSQCPLLFFLITKPDEYRRVRRVHGNRSRSRRADPAARDGHPRSYSRARAQVAGLHLQNPAKLVNHFAFPTSTRSPRGTPDWRRQRDRLANVWSAICFPENGLHPRRAIPSATLAGLRVCMEDNPILLPIRRLEESAVTRRISLGFRTLR